MLLEKDIRHTAASAGPAVVAVERLQQGRVGVERAAVRSAYSYA